MFIIKWFRKIFTNVNDEFIHACVNGDLNKVKTLHKQGADIRVCDYRPLRWAAERGHLDVVRYLVEQGADIHTKNDYAFRWAAMGGHLDVVKYLVEHGPDIHVADDAALRWAAYYRRLDMVNFLREIAGPGYKCHECLIKSTCLELCNDLRPEEK